MTMNGDSSTSFTTIWWGKEKWRIGTENNRKAK